VWVKNTGGSAAGLLCDEHEPSVFESTAQIRRYPFAGKIHKETLSFLIINPPSIAYC
jgi:hypothetical protein